jgi:energy-coupling factor transport system substrate-specific component
MRELFIMWKNTRMVVLTAVSAGVYAAVLIPFKPIPIIPGFTEIRPANVLPIICSLMFGPAGAWGSAFGNLIGDFFGTLGPGSIFGFMGNFLYGLLPYKVWGILSKEGPTLKGSSQLLRYLFLVFLASSVCGVVIGWGVDLLGLVPFSALANIIIINNFLVASILGPFLLIILYPRIKRWGLLYSDILEERELHRRNLRGLGLILLIIGGLGGIVLGNSISLGIYHSGFLGAGFLKGTTGSPGLALGMAPVIFLIFIGSILL